MKTKIIATVFFMMVGVAFCNAQIVYGFNYSGTYEFEKGPRTDYYQDKGDGGNTFTWNVQNRAKFDATFSPIVYADNKQQSYTEQRLFIGSTLDGEYVVSGGVSSPVEWRLDFVFEWDEYANLVEKVVWFNYWASDWYPANKKMLKKLIDKKLIKK